MTQQPDHDHTVATPAPSVKASGCAAQRPTRRALIRAAGGAAIGWLATPALGSPHVQDQGGPPEEAAAAADATPWWLGADHPVSRVVEVRAERALRGDSVDPHVLRNMIDRAVKLLSRAASPEQGWRAILRGAKRIVIKFNAVASAVIGTNDVFAAALVDRLANAGCDPEAITTVELSNDTVLRLGTRAATRGWGGSIPVGGSAEQLAAYFLDADAVINVPLLKTHQIAGMSCCMKNISHAVIRRPARYHANGCSPYVGQVISAPEVRNRLRIHLVNALRVVVDRGPEAHASDVANWGGVLAGFDPVAVDHVGRSILEVQRRERNLDAHLEVPYLRAAGDSGLGRWRPSEIERVVDRLKD